MFAFTDTASILAQCTVQSLLFIVNCAIAVKFWVVDDFLECKSSIKMGTSFETAECLYLEGHMMQYYPAVVFVATLLMVSSKLLLQKCQPSPRTTYTIVMACDLLCAALLVTVYFLLFRSFYCTLTHVTAFGYHRISFYCIIKNIHLINLVLFLGFCGVLVDAGLTLCSIFAKVRKYKSKGQRVGTPVDSTLLPAVGSSSGDFESIGSETQLIGHSV